jgi:PAS domain S-box-containing protein
MEDKTVHSLGYFKESDMGKISGENKFSGLRRRAQIFLEERSDKTEMIQKNVCELVHELDTHRIELELQNEDLRNAQHELEQSRLRYADLYDFAPVGYVTVGKKGLILEANLTVATQLGVTRNVLIKQPLTRFILPEDQDIYYCQRKVLLETRERQTCELRLLRTDGPSFWVVLEATVAEDSEQGPTICRITLSDITERKQAEKALRNTQKELEQSHRRYTDLYDFAPVAYLTVSDKGTILEANLTAATLLGVARGHLLRQLFSTFIVPDDQDAFSLHCKKLLETKEKQSCELRLQRKDGSIFYALMEAMMDQEDCDPRGQYRVTISDISVHKEEDLARLRHLKERYRAIVMDQNELICRFDPQGRLTFVNDAYCRCYGVNHRDILGTNFLPDIHKDDLPLVRDHFKNLTPLNPDKTIEHRVRLPNGRISWQQWCGRALYNENGEVIEYQAVGRDITRRKEAEEKLHSEARLRQLFMDALPCVALLLKYHTREIVASNKAAVAVGAVPGRKCYATWGQREGPCPWCLAPKLWEGGAALNDQFWGLGIYWDAYWIPVGEDLYLHYAFDITEEQKNREALEQAHEELEQRVRERTLELQKSHQQLLHSEKLSAVGSLSASIAHEFNNPLQSVMTIIKGIGQYATLDEKEEKLVALALQECNRMKNLIANLRDFYRPSSGKLALTDLHATLDALLLIGKKDLHTREITVVKKYTGTLPSIMAVPDQLKQVFLNLLTNAADACEGGGTITISTETIEGQVVVHIEDNGTGISPAHLPHIFEPFFTTKPELKGTGLGLSVSYGIIKKHGGHIDVKSEPGKGSLFSVILPVTSTENAH